MSKKRRQKSTLPLVMVAIGVILIVSAVAFLALQPGAQNPSGAETSQDIYPDIQRVSVGDAKAAYDLGQAVFLDVRDAATFAERHIAGAISIPLDELPQRIGELDPAAWIITY